MPRMSATSELQNNNNIESEGQGRAERSGAWINLLGVRVSAVNLPGAVARIEEAIVAGPCTCRLTGRSGY
jgi:hypothetical protein